MPDPRAREEGKESVSWQTPTFLTDRGPGRSCRGGLGFHFPHLLPGGTTMQDTPNILNATLPLKQDAASQAKLQELARDFPTKWVPKVWDVLKSSQMVHYARFTVIDNKYLQILTEY